MKYSAWECLLPSHAREEGRAAQEHAVAMVGARLAHGGRVDNSWSTWRAMVWPTWEAFVGQLWAKLYLGPKSKVEVHELLYNFH